MTGASSTLHERLQALLLLQDHDAHVEQLRFHRAHLEGRARLAQIAEQLQRLDKIGVSLNSERAQQQSRLDELDKHSSEARERISTIEKRSREQSGGSFRDQEAMALEIDSLAKRQRELEDAELEVMELLEPLEVELEKLTTERARLLAEGRSTRAELTRDEQAIDAEIAEADRARPAIAEGVPAELIAEYERLRPRLGGIGVARVVHNSCSGCNLALSATEVDHIRHGDGETLLHCEQCGRILVP